MKKRAKKQPAGAPEWMVTFGDLMALLLTFFILIQMFSELKRDYEFQRVITAVKEAFGYSGGIGVLPVRDPPLRSIIEQLEHMALESNEETDVSQSPDEGVDGPHMRVTRVREGLMFTIGGPSTFDEFSAEIKPAVAEQLTKLASMVRGRNNKIEIRGHAGLKLIPPDLKWRDLDDLSYERAKNVRDILLENGIRDRVIRMQAVGAREPIQPRSSDPNSVQENRRVDVVLTEELVEDTNQDVDHTNPDLARGG